MYEGLGLGSVSPHLAESPPIGIVLGQRIQLGRYFVKLQSEPIDQQPSAFIISEQGCARKVLPHRLE